MKKELILNLFTSNKDKYNETLEYFKKNLKFPFELRKITHIDIKEIQGTSEQIILNKLNQAVNSKIQGIIIVEDTSFCVEGMNELPGPYIKDFFLKLGNLLLFQLFSNFSDEKGEIKAKDCSFIALFHKDFIIDPIIFKGITKGTIVKPQNLEKDEFNWNFFFLPKNQKIPYGEMNSEQKNKVSARYKALRKLTLFLNENFK